MGEKAHSALLNCSPNDRRTSVRPRPFPRHQPSGTYPAGCCRLRYRSGYSACAPIVAGLDLEGTRSDAKLASVSLANRPALQTGLLDDTGRRRSLGGTCSRLRRVARLHGARRAPVGRARVDARCAATISAVRRRPMRSSALPRPRQSGAGAASPPWTRPPRGTRQPTKRPPARVAVKFERRSVMGMTAVWGADLNFVPDCSRGRPQSPDR